MLAALPVHAGLFDDEEARKAIVELRARVLQNDEQIRTRLTELAAAQAQTAAQMAQQMASLMGEQLTALRRSLLDLNNQIEATRADLARMRGGDEQLLREIAEQSRRQQEASQALDARIRRLEPVRVTLDGQEFAAHLDERRQYEEAITVMRGGDFDKAVGAFSLLLRRWPGSGYADAARFWQANALYGKRDYKEAIAAFRAFVAASPEHPRAAEALLALANSQAEMKDVRAARRTIEDLMKAYPTSEAAQAGKERLAALK